jgi:hypothetical protein
MKRRQLIKTGLLGGLSIGAVSAGAVWLNVPANIAPLTIAVALKKLDKLSRQEILSSGEWSPYQIFTHCAQSIEFSLSGFPEHKSEFFKNTAGQLAFSAFSTKGQMTHSLSEPIQQFEGKLAAHFAYGELSKPDYERAHVMHFYNHLHEITVS